MVAFRDHDIEHKYEIDESMRMKFFVSDNSGGNKVLMNSGSEWRGDAIPRAIFGAPGLQKRGRPEEH